MGKTGDSLRDRYLPILGLNMEEVARDNTLRCRWLPPGRRVKTNDLPAGKELSTAVDCCRQYDYTGPDIKLILLLGDPAFRRFYPDLKASEWIGHLAPVGALHDTQYQY